MARAHTTYPAILGMYIVPAARKRDGTPSKANVPFIAVFDAPQRLSVVCMGSDRHRRKDGRMCWHVESFVERLRPWWRSRCYVRLPHETEPLAGVKARAA